MFGRPSLVLGMLGTLGGCQPASTPASDDRAIEARQAADDAGTRVASPTRCACPPATGCEILGRHAVGSPIASERGFGWLTIEQGRLVCDPEAVSCPPEFAAPSATIVVTSPACGLWGNYLLEDATNVYIQHPQSIGSQGGPGYALVAVNWADPGSYEPLPHGFGRDATRVFDHGEWLVGADVRSFEVLQCDDACRACDAERCW